MKKMILFRLKDDSSVWLADLEAGTVEQADPSVIESGEFAREGDAPFVKGIDFALAAGPRPAAASHYMFPSR